MPTLLVMMHSFTPAMNGVSRPWHCGVLYHRDARFAHALRDALLAEGDLVVGDNQPYSVNDSSDSERASSPVTTEMCWPSSAACRFTAASVVGSDAPGARRTASSQAYRSSASGET